ncbi:MAG: elongation factor G [Pseudomonadota bacterium]
MKYDTTQIRNIGVYGHSGAGKTSLLEGMLYKTKVTDRLGRIENGNTFLDFEAEEHSKQISLYTTFCHLDWNKHKINFIDTPGDTNFAADARGSMLAADACLIVVDAIEGIKLQSERAYALAKEIGIPVAFVINKLDKEHSNFETTLENINNTFGIQATLMQIPVGTEANFNGVVDLWTQKAHIYKDKETAEFDACDVPDDLKDQAGSLRESLIEGIAESDDDLLEKYLEEGELNEEEAFTCLNKGISSGNIHPVFICSAYTNIGTNEILDAIVNYFPSPVDRKIIAKVKDSEEELEITTASNETCAFVFKTIMDPFAGRLTLIRLFSGKFETNGSLYNVTKNTNEKFGTTLKIQGKKQEAANEVVTGDILALPKLKESQTGDTFTNGKKLLVAGIPNLPGLISYVIKPQSRADEDKLHSALEKILEEDGTLTKSRDEQTSDLMLTGMGQAHLEVTLNKMKRKFGVTVNLEPPKVPYKETIKGKTEVQGKYKKQSGGKGQYGDTWIKIEPNVGKGFEFVDGIVGGSIPKTYIPAVEKGIVEAMAKGVIAGYPVIDIKITLFDGSYHDVDSSEMSFKIAGSMGFKKGFVNCKPILLEPIMNMEITVPDENMGDVMGDISSRRGKVAGMEAKGSNQVIKAVVPMVEILTYVNDLTSMTSGKGSYTMEFSNYEEVPTHLSQKIIDERKASDEEED